MKVAVTGGAGFIGLHLTDYLVLAGHEVSVLDNLSSGSIDSLNSRVHFHQGDIRDLSSCESAIRGADAVVHLAAMSRSGPSSQYFDECLTTNILGTRNVFEASANHEVKRFIYAASSTCYGNLPTPHRVDSPPDLLNPYGWSKYAAEQMLLTLTRSTSMGFLSLRFFNVYGPGEPVEGEYALVLGTFIGRYLQNLPLEIHGDGLQSRDFIHVSDIVTGIVAALTSTASGVALNLGTGISTSVKDLADMISDRQIYGPRRKGDALHTLADIQMTKDVLMWEPKIPIADGVKRALSLARNPSIHI
jgi:UDP-glucose 4-epimerase